MVQYDFDRFVLDDDVVRVDRAVLWAFLSEQAYWGRWRAPADLDAQLDGSWRVVGAYEAASGAMVGFARAVSDGVAFAYLADVFVLESCRGLGVGAELVRAMVELGPGARFRWALHTSDAHELYRRFGFQPPDDTFMERPGRLNRP